jgi:methionyl-tRNA formyltransferase
MGTPEFAVGILDTILKNNHEVVGVITAQTNLQVVDRIKIFSCKRVCAGK